MYRVVAALDKRMPFSSEGGSALTSNRTPQKQPALTNAMFASAGLFF